MAQSFEEGPCLFPSQAFFERGGPSSVLAFLSHPPRPNRCLGRIFGGHSDISDLKPMSDARCIRASSEAAPVSTVPRLETKCDRDACPDLRKRRDPMRSVK